MDKLAYALYAIGIAMLVKGAFRSGLEFSIIGIVIIVGAFGFQKILSEQ